MTPPIRYSTELTEPVRQFTVLEEAALSGFLAGYCGLTRVGSAPVRQLCAEREIHVFGARRADRDLGPAPRSA